MSTQTEIVTPRKKAPVATQMAFVLFERSSQFLPVSVLIVSKLLIWDTEQHLGNASL